MAEPNSTQTSDNLLTRARQWWELILAIITAIGAVITALGIGSPLWRAIAFAVAAMATAISYLAWRRGRKRESARLHRVRIYQEWGERKPEAAFRGLFPYETNDTLPGEDRRRTAVRIATQVASPDFYFGVVSGDIGCGKSSLLRSGVTHLLENNRCQVLLLRSPRDIFPNRRQAEPTPEELVAALEKLRSKCSAMGESPVLIVDQFEELLIEYPEREHRQIIGAFLREPLPDKHMRVLCAIRSDYLVELHDLSPALPEPLSARNLFRLRNFSETEASEIILECAERDHVKIDQEFAALIAADLAHGGSVRPPELQLVCSAISNDMSVSRYRTAGGATGILSEHIKNAIAVSSRPELARLVLRELCDFVVLPPAKKAPQTDVAIAAKLGLRSEELSEFSRILGEFERSKLVIATRSGDNLVVSLIHDYLVAPIATATGDIRTPQERADELLRLHLFQMQQDASTTVPLRRYKFITTHASSELLATARVKQLLNHSRNSYFIRGTGVALGITFGVLFLYALLNTQQYWRREVVGRHYPASQRGSVTYDPTETGRHVWAGTFSGNPYIRLWDAATGTLLYSDSADAFTTSPKASFLLIMRNGQETLDLINLTNRQRYPTPLSTKRETFGAEISDLAFTDSEKFLIEYASADSPSTELVRLKIWSVPDFQMIDSLRSRGQYLYITANGERVLLLAGNPPKLTMWKVDDRSSTRFMVLADSGTFEAFAVDESSMLVASSEIHRRRVSVHLWNLRTGEKVRTRQIPQIPVPSRSFTPRNRLAFSGSGRHLFIIPSPRFRAGLDTVFLVSTADLRPPVNVPAGGTVLVWSASHPVGVLWSASRGNAIYWSETGVDTVAGLGLQTIRNLGLNRDSSRAVITRVNDKIELWDWSRYRHLVELESTGPQPVVSFTLDSKAVLVSAEGGTYHLFRARDGEKLSSLDDVGSIQGIVFYHETCEWQHFWTRDGLTLRYTYGLRIPFVGFHAMKRCREPPNDDRAPPRSQRRGS